MYHNFDVYSFHRNVKFRSRQNVEAVAQQGFFILQIYGLCRISGTKSKIQTDILSTYYNKNPIIPGLPGIDKLSSWAIQHYFHPKL